MTSTATTELSETAPWKIRHSWEISGTAVAFHPDGRLLAIANGDHITGQECEPRQPGQFKACSFRLTGVDAAWKLDLWHREPGSEWSKLYDVDIGGQGLLAIQINGEERVIDFVPGGFGPGEEVQEFTGQLGSDLEIEIRRFTVRNDRTPVRIVLPAVYGRSGGIATFRAVGRKGQVVQELPSGDKLLPDHTLKF